MLLAPFVKIGEGFLGNLPLGQVEITAMRVPKN